MNTTHESHPAENPDQNVGQYDFAAIESRWQAFWESQQTNLAPNPGDTGFRAEQPKYFVLDMFPYPSGVGLHVGHPLGFIATDIVARFKRMAGFNVLHTMGFDAFGLPAEQYAVETGVHPAITTQQNIDNMNRQLRALGMGYDWSRQLATTDPDYYRWTQWIFLQLYNSYFDPLEQKARPISELRRKLEGEDYYVGISGELILSGTREDLEALEGPPSLVHKWYELDAQQQERLIDTCRLAFLDEVPVNWCPALGTVLANEEVTAEGRSERGNHPVFKRPLKQWMLRITSFADRLIQDLDIVDWPEPIKLLQRNWIGKSTGAEVDFPIAGDRPETQDETIRVFTTRPDTLFGATYMVLAPEHPLVEAITTDEQRGAVTQYQAEAAAKADVDRQADTKEKTGVFTGAYATNPLTNQPIPVWIADYVMMGYGTGAIMAVPAHDERDFAFAQAFRLPIIYVVAPKDGHPEDQAYTGDGTLINSSNDDVTLDELAVPDAKKVITAYLEQQGFGKATVQYKLRDWLFSRQRYWGEPFPILHELDDQGQRTGSIRGIDEADLPVALPEMDDFKPHGSDDPNAPVNPPLGRAPEAWRYVTIDGQPYERELNTMPQWAGSCWYYLRYLDPTNEERFVGQDAEHYWMVSKKKDGTPHAGGVDLYVGGVEHAVLHLLYARFWHKVLFDLGHVATPEPFGKLFNQGYIQAYCYRDKRGIAVPAAEVVNEQGQPASEVQGKKGQKYFYNEEPVTEEYGKMGKSLKNAATPDEVCDQYGADSLRLYEMYLGPLEASKPWSTRDIVGVHRFLQRVWRNLIDEATGQTTVVNAEIPDDLNRLLHKTIAGVTADMEAMRFNTAIAKLIELNNALTKLDAVPRLVAEELVAMLAPMAPHIAEELWEKLGHQPSVTRQPWPVHDPKWLVQDTLEIPVQVNGKVRSKITVPADADQAAVQAAAEADPAVAAAIAGKTLRKAIVVPGRMVNLVVG